MSCCGSDKEETKVEGVAGEGCCKDESCCGDECCNEKCGLCKRFLKKFKENKSFRRVTIVVAAILGILFLSKVLKKKK